jgi:hypothetical protein
MKKYQKQIVQLIRELHLDEITETKKQSILDDINVVITQRIILRLLDETPRNKKSLFVQKINEHRSDPDKMLLFIDHFVDNAQEIIEEEVITCKNDLTQVITQSKK